MVSDPTQSILGWQFAAATYVRDAHGGSNNDNDVYSFVLPGLSVGTYAYVGRASLDSGAHWTWLDADEANPTFDSSKMGVATVFGRRVDWARIVTPPNAARVTPGAPIAARVQVYEAGLTGGAGMGAGLEVQVGAGPKGGDPAALGFNYTAAKYTRDVDGLSTLANDEFDWTGVAPDTVGDYDIVAKVRIGAGSWLYADTSGSTPSDDSYDAAFALGLAVLAQPSGGVVDWCRLQAPTGTTTLVPGASITVYGQVHANVPSGSVDITGPSGTGPTPRGQVGYGPRGTTPPSGWTWGSLGAFNLWPATSNNDEQWAPLTAPTTSGSYDWAWRFSMDGGAVWLYCDDNGATSAGEYSPVNAGQLEVQP